MATPVGLLDFFTLEGSEYVERLDGLLAAAGAGAPDAAAFAQAARALRGSATMAKLQGMAEVAGAIERVARGLRDGLVPWSPAIRGALVAAVDDAKILIRAVRTWSEAEDRRVATRVADLLPFAPTAHAVPTPQAVGSVTFMATETEAVARAVDDFLARAGTPDALAMMLQRVRALRGVAALRDLPPLAEVVAALERAVQPLELADTPITLQPAAHAVVACASALLHRAAGEIRAQGRPDPASPLAQRFAAAVGALDETHVAVARIVPIASLYHADDGPHLVSRAPNPPTTPAERFRLEVVSQAEHLRRLIGDTRQGAADPTTRSRLARELRGALDGLGDAAESFGEHEVTAFTTHVRDDASALDTRVLAAIDEVAQLLADARTRPAELARRLGELSRARLTMEVGAVLPGRATPSGVGAPAGKPTPASGKELQAILQSSIAGMARMERDPSSAELAAIPDTTVPIEGLLYRGPAALHRARVVRDELRARGGAPDPALLDELYELLDLAAAG